MAKTNKYVIESVAADKRRGYCEPEYASLFPHNYELHYIEKDGSEVFNSYAFSRKIDDRFALYYTHMALIEEEFGDNCGIWGIADTAEKAEFRVYKKLRDYVDEINNAAPNGGIAIDDRTRFAPLDAKTS